MINRIIKKIKKIFSGNNFLLRDQIRFAERLTLLLEAGVSLLEAIAIIREQAAGKKRKEFFTHLLTSISNGNSLTESLKKYPLFDSFGINIVHIGEMTGSLAVNLKYVADSLQKKFTVKRKIISASIYPSIILLSTISLSAFLVLFIFPKIRPLFSSVHLKLPLSTKILIGSSAFLGKYWLIILGSIIFISILVTIVFITKPGFKHFINRTLLRIPIIGGIYKNYYTASYFRILGILLKSGMGLGESLGLIANISTHSSYRKAFTESRKHIERGEQLSKVLSRYKNLFPPAITHLLSVGETTGNLSVVCIHLSDIADHDIDEQVKRFSEILEPALMICMGLFVGFISISIITPIYEITQNIR